MPLDQLARRVALGRRQRLVRRAFDVRHHARALPVPAGYRVPGLGDRDEDPEARRQQGAGDRVGAAPGPLSDDPRPAERLEMVSERLRRGNVRAEVST